MCARPLIINSFDGMRFNSSSQITHICLTLSSGALERELQMFLACCLMEERQQPVQAVTKRPFVIFLAWLGSRIVLKVLIFTIVKLISQSELVRVYSMLCGVRKKQMKKKLQTGRRHRKKEECISRFSWVVCKHRQNSFWHFPSGYFHRLDLLQDRKDTCWINIVFCVRDRWP